MRIYGRNPNKMEYDSVPLRNSHNDKHIRQGWFHKSEPYHFGNLYTTNNDIRVFYRSTDIERIAFGKISYFEYRKTENTNGPGIEFLAAGIGLLTSPIWLNSGGKPNWTLFYVCAGIVSLETTFVLIRNHRSKLRTYNFNDWQIKKIK